MYPKNRDLQKVQFLFHLDRKRIEKNDIPYDLKYYSYKFYNQNRHLLYQKQLLG